MQIVSAYEEFLEYLAERATPEEIIGFTASAAQQERFEVLMERSKRETLLLGEQEELEQMVRFNRLVTLLKAKAMHSRKKS